MRTRFERLKHFLHVCYEVYVFHTLLLAVAGVVGGALVWYQSNGFGTAVPTSALIAISLVLVLALLLLGFLFLVWKRRIGQAMETLLVERVKAEEESRLLKQEVEGMRAEQMALDSIGGAFRSFARQSTECDKKIFDLALVETDIIKAIPQQNLRLAQQNLTNNIENALINICNIMSLHTRCECSASIKLIHDTSADDELDWKLITDIRDPRSRSQTPYNLDGPTQIYVRDNTANIEIIKNGLDHFCSNDLLAMRKNGQYTNRSANFHEAYNATVVVPIHGLYTKYGQNHIVGLLCVDNFRGGLTTIRSKHYMQEFAWRLSIMYYRLARLKQATGGQMGC